MCGIGGQHLGHLRSEGRDDIAVHILDLSDEDGIHTYAVIDEGGVARDHLADGRFGSTERHSHRSLDRAT